MASRDGRPAGGTTRVRLAPVVRPAARRRSRAPRASRSPPPRRRAAQQRGGGLGHGRDHDHRPPVDQAGRTIPSHPLDRRRAVDRAAAEFHDDHASSQPFALHQLRVEHGRARGAAQDVVGEGHELPVEDRALADAGPRRWPCPSRARRPCASAAGRAPPSRGWAGAAPRGAPAPGARRGTRRGPRGSPPARAGSRIPGSP